MTSPESTIFTFNDAVRRDVKPHAIPQDAFVEMTNAYQFRGRVIKRKGYTTLGRLSTDGGTTFTGLPVMGCRIQEQFGVAQQNSIFFDTQNAYRFNGSVFSLLPSVNPTVWSGTNYQFFYTTNYAGGFWATNSKPGLHGWAVTLFASSSGTGTSAVTNVTSTGNAAAVGDTIYFLNLAGAGAANNLVFARVTAINVGGNPAVITVQAINVPSSFAFTNGAVTGFMMDSSKSIAGQDGIRYYGALNIGNSWANYNPPIDGQTALAGALLIFAYRGYLVFLNTTEGTPGNTFNFGNRARWTQIGTPYYSLPVPQTPNIQDVDPLAVRDDLFGRGGANDAPTSEVIIAAGFIRDLLVVEFERSTWRLRFVNNTQNPFVWERVNIELGSDSTFSAIAFDKGLMSIGTRGIIISDGNDTSRFDEKIPDEVFNIRQSNNGLERIYGIRTFETRLNYWTFPSADSPDLIFPNRVLVFNYDTKNWSFYDDSFTCFGYYYSQGNNTTWAQLTDSWSSYTALTWGSGNDTQGSEMIVAGNQQGYILVLEQTSGQNGPSLAISAITAADPGVFTSTNHNLADGDWITLSGITGITSDDGVSLNGRNFKVANPTQSPTNFSLLEFAPIEAGIMDGTLFNYDIDYANLVAGSIQVNVDTLVFTDPNGNGILVEASGNGSGTINYATGELFIESDIVIFSSPVYIRIVSYDPTQGLDPVVTTGTYTGGGEIARISNIDIQTKYFNLIQADKRVRMSRVDFYMESTDKGQFTCNIWGDSSNIPINTPLPENPLSNIVKTTIGPYQIGLGDEVVYRLYCESNAQTVQMQMTYSDQQMATDIINQSDIQILSMMIKIRSGGRII